MNFDVSNSHTVRVNIGIADGLRLGLIFDRLPSRRRRRNDFYVAAARAYASSVACTIGIRVRIVFTLLLTLLRTCTSTCLKFFHQVHHVAVAINLFSGHTLSLSQLSFHIVVRQTVLL